MQITRKRELQGLFRALFSTCVRMCYYSLHVTKQAIAFSESLQLGDGVIQGVPGVTGIVLLTIVTWVSLYWLLRGPPYDQLWDIVSVVTWTLCVCLIAWPHLTVLFLNYIIQIRCHKVEAAERLTDSLTAKLHPAHNQPVFAVNLSTNSQLSRPWSEKNTERTVFFSDSFSMISSPLITS